MSEDLKFLLEMYCQGSIYMTVQWVFGRVKRTPEELAADLVKAMPEELAGVFEGWIFYNPFALHFHNFVTFILGAILLK